MPDSQTTRRQILTTGAAIGTALLAKPLWGDDLAATEEREPLHLHWMVPPFYNREGDLEKPAQRLVTTLVILSHDFDIATGDSEVRIRGRIEPRGGNFHVDLKATYGPGTMFFKGEVEPERIFDSYGGLFGSLIIATRCALSRSRDCRKFLDEQLAGYEEYQPVRSDSE